MNESQTQTATPPESGNPTTGAEVALKVSEAIKARLEQPEKAPEPAKEDPPAGEGAAEETPAEKTKGLDDMTPEEFAALSADEFERLLAEMPEDEKNRGFLRVKDYTQKTQKLAEFRRETEKALAEREQTLAAREADLDAKLASILEEGYEGQIDEHPRFKELSNVVAQARERETAILQYLLADCAHRGAAMVKDRYGIDPTSEDMMAAIRKYAQSEMTDEQRNDLASLSPEMALSAYETFVIAPQIARNRDAKGRFEKAQDPPPAATEGKAPPPPEPARPATVRETVGEAIRAKLAQAGLIK